MSTIPQSTTPRTDAFEIKAARDAMLNGIAWRPMVFARTIETELTAMQARAEKAEAELVRLRADLERFTGHGLLDCHAICDQRDSAVSERDQLRAENEDLATRAGLRLSALDYEKLNAEALKARAEKAEAECLEQARLLGISGSREAALLSEIECLKKIVAESQQLINTNVNKHDL